MKQLEKRVRQMEWVVTNDIGTPPPATPSETPQPADSDVEMPKEFAFLQRQLKLLRDEIELMQKGNPVEEPISQMARGSEMKAPVTEPAPDSLEPACKRPRS